MLSINGKQQNALKKYKYIDLFAGIGGFRYALDSFGAKCVYTSEWDRHAQFTYKDNFEEIPDGDITKVSEKDIPDSDILCAGFPCQAFSISGKQKGFEDTRGTLFFDVARIIKYHQPKLVFLENVKNFARHDNSNTLGVVSETLSNLGYDIFCEVLNASYFGVPQNRERIYILAFRKNLNVTKYQFPKPTYQKVKLKDILLPDNYTNEYIIKRNDIHLNGTVVMQESISGSYPLKPIRIGTVNKGGQGERIYHELGHAITLSAYGGGVGAKTGLYLINGKVRKLTPRECARLMGFPDDFKINPLQTQAYKQFGNSVVINVLQYILKDIVEKELI